METCPNQCGSLRYYDGALGYEAMRCDVCGYERDLHAEANGNPPEGAPINKSVEEICEGRTIWNSDCSKPCLICAPPKPPTIIQALAPVFNSDGSAAGTVAQGRRPMFKPWKEVAEDRNETIAAIRHQLKVRSGKPWSVTGGRGTAWGWIRIDAPPSRRTFKHREKAGVVGYQKNWSDQFEEYDSGEPGNSMSDAETAELASLLGIEKAQASGGVGIPASRDYREEYLQRAAGATVTVRGEPYWD